MKIAMKMVSLINQLNQSQRPQQLLLLKLLQKHKLSHNKRNKSQNPVKKNQKKRPSQFKKEKLKLNHNQQKLNNKSHWLVKENKKNLMKKRNLMKKK